MTKHKFTVYEFTSDNKVVVGKSHDNIDDAIAHRNYLQAEEEVSISRGTLPTNSTYLVVAEY